MIREGLLVVVAGAGLVSDLRTHRIPNALTFPAMAVGVVVGGAADGVPGAAAACGGIATGFGLLAIQFVLGWVKAGDVKFLMALGAFLGPWRTVWAFLYATVLGGLLAIVVLGVTRTGRQRALTWWIQLKNWILFRHPSVLKAPRDTSRMPIPYGLAVALGALCAAMWAGTLDP